MIAITLLPADLGRADAEGQMRQDNRTRAGSKHTGRRKIDYAKDLLNNQQSAAAELAAHYALGTAYWNAGRDIVGDRSKQADLDHWIDVKLRGPYDVHLAMQFDNPLGHAYLSVKTEDYKTFVLERWCWGYDLAKPYLIKELQPGWLSWCCGMAEPWMIDATVMRDMVPMMRELLSRRSSPSPASPTGSSELVP